MNKIIFTTAILFYSFSSVLGQKVNGKISPIFDVSANEKSLAISISSEQGSFIYQYSMENKKLKQLTKKKNSYHSRPMYSPDGKKIVFLSKQIEREESQISILDLPTNRIKLLNTGEAYVTEAIFHPDGKKIIFCGASFIGNYSPMARKDPHDIDIYSINVDGTDLKKITDFGAYELSSLSLNESGEKIIFESTIKDKLEGIYLMSLTDTSQIVKIEAQNNPRPEIGGMFYGTPYFSRDNNHISFIAPYQVYTLNLKNKTCKLAWDNTKDKIMAMAIHSRFLQSDKKVIISTLQIVNRKYSSDAQLMIVDLSTKKVEILRINQT